MNSTRARFVASVMVAAIAGFMNSAQATQAQQQRQIPQPKFYDDDPLWFEPVTQDVKHARDYEPNRTFTYIRSFLTHPGDPVLGQRAKNVNTVDEVPDGPFFVNRAGRIPLTPEMVARAANLDDGPAPGPWTVASAKTSGVTAGFSFHDSRGTHWFLKFDPLDWPEMATGSEIIGAKLFWALGYHTTEYHIVQVVPSNLVIAATSKVQHQGEAERPMRREDLDRVLALVPRSADGSYRAIASKGMPGKYVGRIRYDGTRHDDPNDIIPHEHHRELRGQAVFAAWLDRVDAKRDNSLVTEVTEGGRTFIRRYMLDWSSSLGSNGVRPREYWEGYEQDVEPASVIAKRAVTLGTLIPQWRLRPVYENANIGRLPRNLNDFDPERWQPNVSNAAYRHARADDKFWAAYKMTFITEDMVRAVVAEAKFSDSTAAARLIDFIMTRRARILSTYLPAINPIVEPQLGKDGRLVFRNAAVDFAGAAPPSGYRAVWSSFDNDTGVTTPIGTTEAPGTTIIAPDLPTTPFLKVEVSCVGSQIVAWELPLTLYFRQRAGNWELVGLERM